MIPNVQRIHRYLMDFDLKGLFIEELGWDRPPAGLEVTLDGRTFYLTARAEKRGMVAYVCPPGPEGQVPDYAMRRKIENQVARSMREHLIVYADADGATQVWQWVKREQGKPTVCREHSYRRGQPGDSLIQRLQALVFTLEEETITLVDVTGRTRAAFDVERVTKRFYDLFKAEQAAFLQFVEGISDRGDREWYTSVMLNRLMFVYFIQKKGFLDGDPDYLRHRLHAIQERRGPGQFLGFYRHFLLRLFHEGLGRRERTADLDALLGRVPYLNGGIFLPHPVEEKHPGIQIPDEAFERLFEFFDRYRWHLDERPLRADNEINPDVLGYIFEKYVNQKEMGAYYTKEDITEYIARSTIVPFLLDAARDRERCRIAFEREQSVWRLLAADPDRYVFPAVRKGAELPLPPEIATGLEDVARREGWNRPAPEQYALPTEIWREVVARRRRYQEVRARLAAGEVRSAEDLVTYNLDLRQLAQDAIQECEGPELLRAFWHALERITVLDPTCGSGAFLFAALNVLEPLYEACLERMGAFVGDLERSGVRHRPERFSDFRKVLDRVASHPNRRYFILKSIVVNNLFGVDIMEEAVEICKLRLFLKLVAQVEMVEEIEPLPDVDFNVRAGNTLVGYATYEEVKRAVTSRLDFEGAMARIEERAADVERLFALFRQQQTELGGEVTPVDKGDLRARLKALEAELNGYLAGEYGVDPADRAARERWLASHRPFHWFLEFYGIMRGGGFDVIIGNPPYVVYSPGKVGYRVEPRRYATHDAKNLYAFVFERSVTLARPQSPVGLIVQLTVMSSERLPSLQRLLIDRGQLIALPFPRRPESMFTGAEMPVAILLSLASRKGGFATYRVGRMYTEERESAMALLAPTPHRLRIDDCRIGKIGSTLDRLICESLLDNHRKKLAELARPSSQWVLYYQEACRYWVKAFEGVPFFVRDGKRVDPPHGRTLCMESQAACAFAVCLLNSSLFYMYYSIFSDCEHINDSIIRGFPIPQGWDSSDWPRLAQRLADSLSSNASRKTIYTKEGHTIQYDEIKALRSKPVIDEIDRILARHYGFTDEELDFIINYDIKYRMGLADVGEEHVPMPGPDG